MYMPKVSASTHVRWGKGKELCERFLVTRRSGAHWFGICSNNCCCLRLSFAASRARSIRDLNISTELRRNRYLARLHGHQAVGALFNS